MHGLQSLQHVYSAVVACADLECRLGSCVAWEKELPFFILFTAGLCSFTAMLALLTHQFPELMGVFAKAVSICQERGLRQGAGKVMKSSIRETGRVM